MPESSKPPRLFWTQEGLYPDFSLADLYDVSVMPGELRKAHYANDWAVM